MYNAVNNPNGPLLKEPAAGEAPGEPGAAGAEEPEANVDKPGTAAGEEKERMRDLTEEDNADIAVVFGDESQLEVAHFVTIS